MKKKRFLEMLALTLAFGMTVIGCEMDTDDDEGGGNIVLPSTDGLLTVTGLSAYNGKYIMVGGGDENTGMALIGMVGINRNTGVVELFPISGGQAEIKIYEVDSSGNLKSYSGSDTVSMDAYISTTRAVVFSDSGGLPAGVIAEGTAQVSFQNGTATKTFTVTVTDTDGVDAIKITSTTTQGTNVLIHVEYTLASRDDAEIQLSFMQTSMANAAHHLVGHSEPVTKGTESKTITLGLSEISAVETYETYGGSLPYVQAALMYELMNQYHFLALSNTTKWK